MAGIVRNGDRSSGACKCCPITTNGSSIHDVIIEGSKPLVVGNRFGRHPCGGKHCRHTEYTVQGNNTVLIGGFPVVLVGMRLTHGDTTATGSQTVSVG